ncbi:hypothetical protein TNIN_293351 [Trichonephila inaurata madagascariensis]|uniref:Uncharacterized protein n=1 Tax=Trichonephila inaurata madagascariensis TaxID=2747483 RepID=A0A8X7C7C3_9ARAC|nr:hypothetical protein TNIN_293351 [Trichonephila inaurata madagascariensis]
MGGIVLLSSVTLHPKATILQPRSELGFINKYHFLPVCGISISIWLDTSVHGASNVSVLKAGHENTYWISDSLPRKASGKGLGCNWQPYI